MARTIIWHTKEIQEILNCVSPALRIKLWPTVWCNVWASVSQNEIMLRESNFIYVHVLKANNFCRIWKLRKFLIWNGLLKQNSTVFEANKNPAKCTQYDERNDMVIGSEDCLTLNIYTPCKYWLVYNLVYLVITSG